MLPKPTTDKRVSLIVGIIFAVCVALVGITMVTLLISDNNISVRDMAITNVTDTAFSVTWVSDEPYVGGIVFQDNDNWPVLFAQSGKSVVFDDRDVELDSRGVYRQVDTGAKARYTHHVTLRGLKPETQYFFRVTGRMNGKVGDIKSATTQKLREDLKTPDPGYGKIEGQDLPTDDGMIVLTAAGKENEGSPKLFSTTLSGNNTYSIDMNPILEGIKPEELSLRGAIKISNTIRSVHNYQTPRQYKPLETIGVIKQSEGLGILPIVNKFTAPVFAQNNDSSICPENIIIGQTRLKAKDGARLYESRTGGNSELLSSYYFATFVVIGCNGNSRLLEVRDTQANSRGFVRLSDFEIVTPSPLGTNTLAILNYEACTRNLIGRDAFITKSGVRFRSEPGTSSRILSTFSIGDIVNVVSCREAIIDGYVWAEVVSDVNGQRGWVAVDFINTSTEREDVQEPVDSGLNDVSPETEIYSTRSVEPSTPQETIPVNSVDLFAPCIAKYGTNDYLVISAASGITEVAGYRNVGLVEISKKNYICFSNSSSGSSSQDVPVTPERTGQEGNIKYVAGLDWLNENTTTIDADNALMARDKCSEIFGDAFNRYVTPACTIPYSSINRDSQDTTCVPSDVDGTHTNMGYLTSNKWVNEDGSLNRDSARYIICRQFPIGIFRSQVPAISASTPADPKAIRGRVLGAGTDQRLELTESGRYAFFANGERIAEQDIVVRDGQVEVRLFNDDNGNGIKDEAESYFDDYTQITFAKEATAEEYALTSGWNLIHLPLIDTRTDGNVSKASDLIDYWNGQGADIKHVARFRGGNFQIFSKRESGTEFAQDFDLIPGEGLFVLNLGTNVNVTFSGNRFESSVPVKLNQGWNLVGLMAPGKSYNSEQVLASMKTQGFSADTVSQFEGGTYQSVISKDNTIFGNNFNITDKRGYFVRVETGGGTNYDPGK
jgi:hypothetical protein